ncbi:MAG: VTT domain-containing protein [Pirellulaceae bacterium]|nr:VTT domain-containing protein [Planctomycetales bacterium]
MKELVRPALLICLVMLVPILPFLAFGSQVNSAVDRWREAEYSGAVTASVIVGLLATDIFLPVPSSVLSTFGGWQFGAFGGTIVSWVGMSIGATLGFALARRYGQRFAHWLSSPSQLRRMETLSQRFGPAVLVLTRGVPVLAEASVLLMGMNRLAWRRFLPPVLLSNLGLSIAYAAFGKQAETHEMLPLALGIAIGLPVVLLMLVASWLPSGDEPSGDEPSAASGENSESSA